MIKQNRLLLKNSVYLQLTNCKIALTFTDISTPPRTTQAVISSSGVSLQARASVLTRIWRASVFPYKKKKSHR